LVDLNLETWNTFFDIVLDWEPKLREIYKEQKELDEI